MSTVVGIDAGGTCVRVLAVTSQGTEVFRALGGPCNWATMPREEFRRHLDDALYGCPRPDAVAICAAGVLTSQDQDDLRAWLAEWFPTAVVGAWADYCGAVAAMRARSTCCVVAGTGSVVASRVGGLFVKSGGCGPLLGDQGSAFDCVRSALRPYFAGEPVGGPVAGALVAQFGTDELSEVVGEIYRSPSPAARLAAMLPSLCAAAEADDMLQEALTRPMQDLAHVTRLHLSRYHSGVSDPRVETFGGMWEASDLLHNVFADHLRRFGIEVLHPEQEPVVGATRLALSLLE